MPDITWGTYGILLLIGLVAGISSGLFGLGGGLIIVPALLLLLALPIHTSIATSLMALLLPVSILAVLNYYHNGHLTLTTIIYGLVIALGLLAGSLLGAKIAISMPADLLRKVFAVFLVLVGIYLLWRKT